MDATGVFVRWRLLDGPQTFRHLIYANSRDVIAQADNGKLYLYQSDLCIASTDTICDTWVEAQPGSEFDSLTKRIVESGCKSAYEHYAKDTDYRYLAKPFSPRYPPLNGAKPKECVVELEYHPDGGEILTYYVLLDNSVEMDTQIHRNAISCVSDSLGLRWVNHWINNLVSLSKSFKSK